MRKLLEEFDGQVLYVFTTYGRVHVGTVTDIVDDVVHLLAPDRTTRVHVNLTDVSGVRPALVEPEGDS